jgi:hypothetical protein
MTLILDAGALVAIERGDRSVVALLKREHQAGRVPRSHGAIVGQVWRGGAGRQVRLARLLPGLEIAPLDDALGRRAGVLLGRARTSDVVDAAVIVLAADGDVVLTSDVDDIAHLAYSAGLDVDVVPV